MKFTKMQGLGNDYVYVNGFEERIENCLLYTSDAADEL